MLHSDAVRIYFHSALVLSFGGEMLRNVYRSTCLRRFPNAAASIHLSGTNVKEAVGREDWEPKKMEGVSSSVFRLAKTDEETFIHGTLLLVPCPPWWTLLSVANSHSLAIFRSNFNDLSVFSLKFNDLLISLRNDCWLVFNINIIVNKLLINIEYSYDCK